MKVVQFPSYHIIPAEAWEIVKYRLDDQSIELRSKILAIEMIARFGTLNSITKDELQACLRWLFDHYDFEGGK